MPRYACYAVIETVSPGNKASRDALRAFVEKSAELLRQGVRLLVIDLFPPGQRGPQGDSQGDPGRDRGAGIYAAP